MSTDSDDLDERSLWLDGIRAVGKGAVDGGTLTSHRFEAR